MFMVSLVHFTDSKLMGQTCLLPWSRVSRGKRAALDDSVSLQIDGDEKREHGPGRKSGPLLSGTAYCISSCSMILLNKVVLSSYNFNAGISLMFYQVCLCHPFAFLVGWSMYRCLMSPNSNVFSTLHAFSIQSITEKHAAYVLYLWIFYRLRWPLSPVKWSFFFLVHYYKFI